MLLSYKLDHVEAMKLKKRLLIQTFSAALGFFLILCVVLFVFVDKILSSDVHAEISRSLLFLAGFSAFIFLAALLVLIFLSVRFAASVSAFILTINEGIRDVSNGSLGHNLDLKTETLHRVPRKYNVGDELKQLDTSFHIMTERLQEHVAKITRTTAEQERIAAELRVARFKPVCSPAISLPFREETTNSISMRKYTLPKKWEVIFTISFLSMMIILS
jgi:methyl-accepting chemotaxis protein